MIEVLELITSQHTSAKHFTTARHLCSVFEYLVSASFSQYERNIMILALSQFFNVRSSLLEVLCN